MPVYALLMSPVLAGVLGALLGSFANVVVHRLPRGESVVHPPSSCPRCGRRIRPWENVPILSWLALRGRCAGCRAPISARYPLVEALTALLFALVAWRWPLEPYGATLLPLLAVLTMLVMLAFIDWDTYLLPDSLTLPALAVALLGPLFYASGSGLPSLAGAALGAALGAGILALVNRLGSLALRRFADTRERLWPIGMDQVNLAALGGALGGVWVGLGLAACSVALNLALKRPLRLPEGPLYGLWALALAAASINPFVSVLESVVGSLAAAGAVAVLGAAFWWLRDLADQAKPEVPPADESDEPVAMGFGDVKLAAVLGALLGWESLLVALFLSFLVGALGGVVGRMLGGDRVIPFGPYLVLGGVAALFAGPGLIAWYLSLLGVA